MSQHVKVQHAAQLSYLHSAVCDYGEKHLGTPTVIAKVREVRCAFSDRHLHSRVS
jgi:hypothetical protein